MSKSSLKREEVRRITFQKEAGRLSRKTKVDFFLKVPMFNAWSLASHLRNDNASVRAWAAINQCRASIEMSLEHPKEEDPYGQLVFWDGPYFEEEIYFSAAARIELGQRLGYAPISQAHIQGAWDFLRFLTEDYNAERAELFGDPAAYYDGYFWAYEEQSQIGYWDIESFVNFGLFDKDMQPIPRAVVAQWVQSVRDAEEAARLQRLREEEMWNLRY